MRIRSMQVRHFRSIENSGLTNCGGLNVLIGKNNAGKSNLLAAVEICLRHLKRGLIASILSHRRATEQFTDRRTDKPYRIAVEFELPADVNEKLRERLSKEAPHLDRSIEQIKANNRIVFVIAGTSEGIESWLFLEQILVGSLGSNGEELKLDGIRLLSVPASVGRELAHIQQQIGSLSADLKRVQALSNDRRWQEFALERKGRLRSYPFSDAQAELSKEQLRVIEERLSAVTTIEGATAVLGQLSGELKDQIEEIKKRETSGSISAFAGPAKVPPAYATWLMEEYGSVQVLHLQETKAPIGRDEADTLLDMKLQRGGMEQLQTLQQTVRALLGVAVDAFQARERGGERTAEMDVDNFLVEANGAGIRESLRLILDLELKKPELLLVEEPEVHLHPGLARVMATYLRDKSEEVQMFVTTHSTEFVDSVAFQNAYLISRDSEYRTACQAMNAVEGPLLLPAELGLRLSTVFMFDRLLFVEGPSDESVIRTIAKSLQIDLTKSNIGFVHMCGVRNFAHFAAEGTLDLLSRRQIDMWFIVDRDERDDDDVKKMVGRLGARAILKVLDKRELDYLLDGAAVRTFMQEKQAAAKVALLTDNPEAVRRAIEDEAASLKAEVVRLRLVRKLLSPIFMNVRTSEGTIEERMSAGVRLLTERLEGLGAATAAVEAEVSAAWATKSLDLAPGTLVLERVAKRYGVKFSKANGDSDRLARHLRADGVPDALKNILKEVTREDAAINKHHR
jgi:putative ATP-dependent endonuclease of the OLD family